MSGHGGFSRGLWLVVPAGLVLVGAVVWPTVRVLVASFRLPVHAYKPGAVIPGNYWVALRDGSGARLPAGLLATVLPLLVFVVVGGLAGWAASRAGRRARLVTRCVLVVPMACFVPAVAGAAWLHQWPQGGLRVALLAGTFGLMCGCGVMAYAAAVRGGRRAVVLVSGLAVLAAAAAGVQVFAVPALAGGGLMWLPRLPATEVFRSAAWLSQYDELGPAAANVIVMVAVLAVLGVAAVAFLVGFRARLVVLPRGAVEPAVDRRATVGVRLVVGVVLPVCGFALWPWLRGLFEGLEPANYDAVHALSATWVPALPSTLVSVGVAVAAGFGIGALRPFGHRSEWLLMLFAPWVFVGVAPYAVARFLDHHRGLVSHTPPMWLSVPALVVFTLLFAGQEPAYRRAVAAGTPPRVAWVDAYVRPVLPAVVLAGLVIWVVQAYDYFWWGLVTELASPGGSGTPLSAYAAMVKDTILFAPPDSGGSYPFTSGGVSTSMVTPLPLVLAAAAVLVVAQFYLDRWAIITAPRGSAVPAPTGSLPAATPSPAAVTTASIRARVCRAVESVVGVARQPPSGQPRPHLRTMLVCGLLGIVFTAAGILVSCTASSGRLPHPPGAPPAPQAPAQSSPTDRPFGLSPPWGPATGRPGHHPSEVQR